VKDTEAIIEDYDRKAIEALNEADVRDLAAALNGPEHPIPSPAEVAKRVHAPVASDPVQSTEWVTYKKYTGEEWPLFETDGTTIRCRECTDWTTDNKGRLNSHSLTVHQKERMREAVWSNDEVQTRRADSLRYQSLADKVNDAALGLLKMIGRDDGGGERVAELEELLAASDEEAGQMRAKLEQVTKERDELKAKLDLMREAMSGL
jgi:hypothetical protein